MSWQRPCDFTALVSDVQLSLPCTHSVAATAEPASSIRSRAGMSICLARERVWVKRSQNLSPGLAMRRTVAAS